MAKSIVIESMSTPDEDGYHDKIAVFSDDNILYHGQCSCCPNPSKPWPRSNIKWQECYGWLACGLYKYEYWVHNKRGPVLLLNAGVECAARFPNINHGGKKILTEIMVHKGWTSIWRGSAGCVTIPPDKWRGFIGCFVPGDYGDFRIIQWAVNVVVNSCVRSPHCPLYEQQSI